MSCSSRLTSADTSYRVAPRPRGLTFLCIRQRKVSKGKAIPGRTPMLCIGSLRCSESRGSGRQDVPVLPPRLAASMPPTLRAISPSFLRCSASSTGMEEHCKSAHRFARLNQKQIEKERREAPLLLPRSQKEKLSPRKALVRGPVTLLLIFTKEEKSAVALLLSPH